MKKVENKVPTMKPQSAPNLTLFKALAAFQQECPVILKDTSGFGYKYADLPAIFAVINPLLKKHKLGFTQLVNKETIDTILFSLVSGETLASQTMIKDNVQLAKMNDFQVLGSQITYLRRYAISSMLGIITDKDTDAGGEQNRAPKKTSNEPFKVMSKENMETMKEFLKDGKKAIVVDALITYKDSAYKKEVIALIK